MSSSRGLTVETVRSMGTIMQVTRALDSLDIDYTGATSLTDLRQMLIDGLDKQRVSAILANMDDILVSDSERQLALLELYNDTLSLILECEMLEPVTLTELNQYCPDVIEKLKNYVDDLSQQCPIFVAGETSSGKTKFVNLLLGESLLPESVLHSTSVLCHVNYGESKTMTVKHADGRTENFDLDIEERARKQLMREKIANTTSSAHEIEITWPIALLKGRLSIVDSPGIGSLEEMDSIVYSFVPRVAAFIYIVNTANAGGFQGDRLVKLVKYEPMPGEDTGHLSRLDPDLAMFVLHKWDQVPKDEDEKTENTIFENMELHWPGLKREQLFKLSSVEAAECLKITGRRSLQFTRIWGGLTNMIPIALRMNAKSHYNWIRLVVDWLQKIIDVKIAKATGTIIEKESEMHNMNERIPKLRDESDVIIEELRGFINGKKGNIVDRLKQHMASRAARESVASWSENDRDFPKGTDFENIQTNAAYVIKERIIREFKKWTDDSDAFVAIIKEMKRVFTDKLLILNEEFRSCDNELFACSPKGSGLLNIPTMPSVDWEKVLHGKNDLYYYASKLKDEFNKNKCAALRKLSENVLMNVTDGMVRGVVDSQFVRLERSLDVLKEVARRQLDTDKQVLTNALNDTRAADVVRECYEPLQKKCRELRERVIEFGRVYFD